MAKTNTVTKRELIEEALSDLKTRAGLRNTDDCDESIRAGLRQFFEVAWQRGRDNKP